MEAIAVACITSGCTLAGVVIAQWVQFRKLQADRVKGIEESRVAAALREQALNNRLDRIDEKLDLHNDKLDRHNGFEGRIIRLESIAEMLTAGIDDGR